MRPNLLITIILALSGSCQSNNNNLALFPNLADTTVSFNSGIAFLSTIKDIPVPAGYHRTDFSQRSFATWLRNLKLKRDNRVFLHTGELKKNQSAQFAVIDVPVGKKNLQQCADAIMRLRAQYLFDEKRFGEISFRDNSGKEYNYSISSNQPFENYLEKVFSYCGTLSLQSQLEKVRKFDSMKPGDVLIKGGSPGHAVIILDVAEAAGGKKIYLLAQSYMPAQDIHILKNPMDISLSPWYEVNDNSLIYTPEWTFDTGQLKKW